MCNLRVIYTSGASTARALPECSSATEREVLTLVWFNVISAAHTRLHAVANWGVNVNAPDAFVRQNGVVTTILGIPSSENHIRHAAI